MQYANEVVKRWDVYDAADHLDGAGYLILHAVKRGDMDEAHRIAEFIDDWAHRLVAASARGGKIGPSPYYAKVK